MPPPPAPPPTEAASPQDPFDEKLSANTSNTLYRPPQDHSAISITGTRDQDTLLFDEVELQRAERLVSTREHELTAKGTKLRTQQVVHEDSDDDFAPPETRTRAQDPQQPDTPIYRFWLRVKKFPRFIRYFLYLIPGALLLLIPVLIGYFVDTSGINPVGGDGGVDVMWFGIWLEIVWCSLWVSRMITSVVPWIFKGVAILVASNTPKKWKDVGHRLELPFGLFLWMLAVLVSYLPTLNNHRVPIKDGDNEPDVNWIPIVYKVIISLFVLSTLNFVEKVLIQWIATSFHQRTYALRQSNNKGAIQILARLYEYSKNKIPDLDDTDGPSGTRTPMQAFSENARQAWSKVGMLANKLGNDFIGRKVPVNHPRKVVTELLRESKSAHVLARIIYRALRVEGRDNVLVEDMQVVFPDADEAEEAFGIFDRDLNGDISMEEFECVCNEIHLERKAIAASMKDLDSVIKKLDNVFVFVIIVVAIIILISIISGSAASALASAGTTVLGLAWMLQATAQEFLQSIIFVFVKHPFDVGDRVTIYGNTGALGRGDDYYVTTISLLYTEFKKMEGHIVQAPNSTLNTLFILNHRRSNALADPIELKIRFGTTEEQVNELKARMVQFCLANKRDYHARILTEVRTLDELRSATMNFIFFHKSSYQNELLRLSRHNRFATELMGQMMDLGIQGPYRNEPGGSREFPLYWHGTAPPAYGNHESRKDHMHSHAHTDHHGMDELGRNSSTTTTGLSRLRTEPRVSELAEESFADFKMSIPPAESSTLTGTVRFATASMRDAVTISRLLARRWTGQVRLKAR
ncbi:unnamed protein product [Parascedosporium putredinis]|uniref:Mechanosensitive ion channel protein n=1 Tax=Parascedosporium putredinis TaxID=1442378 RepID=A0A9P1H0R1_9PEZI|nr:unnamed protein product [Parascedosporium putredinis]CAI7993050.1 unnamed protein product [Parascedosporium putredinis]